MQANANAVWPSFPFDVDSAPTDARELDCFGVGPDICIAI